MPLPITTTLLTAAGLVLLAGVPVLFGIVLTVAVFHEALGRFFLSADHAGGESE